MLRQVYAPVAGSLVFSTLVAVIPILVLFILLAGLRVAAQWASLITLAIALVIGVVVYGMPLGLALNSTLLGICFGLFPIVWIVINAIFIYNIVVETGHFNTIRDSLAGVSNDRRIQVVLIAFVFGALLEATAGFGTPVAITAPHGGPGLRAPLRRGARPTGEHGTGRVRRLRHPDPDRGYRGWIGYPGALADGRSPDAPAGINHPRHAGDGYGRVQADARGVARGRGERHRLRGTQFVVSNVSAPSSRTCWRP